jgi:membrane-anchored glycerophosphoryl diester phosphodiesterase (GDPDase)
LSSASENNYSALTSEYIRAAVTMIFVIGYFIFLFTITGVVKFEGSNVIDLEENPVITVLLGILSTALALIIQFYYRRGTPQ